MKYIMPIALLFAASLCYAGSGLTRVQGYLVQNGLSPELATERGGPVKVLENANGSIKKLIWNSTRLGISQPTLRQLPLESEALLLLSEYYATHAQVVVHDATVDGEALYAAKQSLLQFYRDKSVISSNDVAVSAAQVILWLSSWDSLAPAKLQELQSDYLRVLLPVILLGGDVSVTE